MSEVTSGFRWMRSSFCSTSNCVEVARRDATLLVRDSKDPAGHVLAYSLDEWRAFVSAVKAGEFDFIEP